MPPALTEVVARYLHRHGEIDAALVEISAINAELLARLAGEETAAHRYAEAAGLYRKATALDRRTCMPARPTAVRGQLRARPAVRRAPGPNCDELS